MNAPFEISEETQLRMNKYNADVLNKVTELFARPGMPRPSKPLPSLSDEDKGNERKAQNIFYLALGEFRSKVQDAQALTNVKKDMLGELLDGLDDLTPDAIAWSEAISTGGIK